jgi:peptidoglycan/LPS O-acetylase OafA/YrhL
MAKRLLLLNGMAIVGVILFHATGYGFTAMFSWAHRYRPVTSPNYDEIGTTAYYALRLVEQFVVFSIPAFLFVSGFFVSVLAGRTRATIDGRTVRARIRSLVVPYLFWSAVVLGALALQGRVFSETRYLAMLATGATNPNYYYVPLLVQFYLVAPLIVLLARRWWKPLLAATAVLQLAVYALQYVVVVGADVPTLTAIATALPKWFFGVQLFWFTVGVVAGFQQHAVKDFVTRTAWLWPGCAVFFFVLGVIEWEVLLRLSGHAWTENRVTIIDGLYAGTFILAFLSVLDVRPAFAGTLATLGAHSYGIYLVHGLAMEYFSRTVYHVTPWLLSQQALFVPLVIALGLAAPLLLMRLVRRSPVRGMYSYVFG